MSEQDSMKVSDQNFLIARFVEKKIANVIQNNVSVQHTYLWKTLKQRLGYTFQLTLNNYLGIHAFCMHSSI